MKNISKKYLNELRVPMPPLSVQQKVIAAINDIEERKEKSEESIRKLKNQIHELLDNLTSNEIKLGEVVSFKNGLNYSRQSNGDLVTIVGVKDFKEYFSPILSELESVQIDGVFSSDYELLPNDILVVRSNGSANLVGRFLFINGVNEQTSFSGFTIRIRSNSKDIDTKFLCHYLRTDIVRERMTKDSKGPNIKNLNQGLLSSIKIPKLSLLE